MIKSKLTVFFVFSDEKNEKRKEVIRQKAAEYMDRAEKIKEIMKNQTDTVGSGGSAR
jgi:hypothetical protein